MRFLVATIPRSSLHLGTCLVLFGAWVGSALAQPAPELVPPVVQSSTDVPYPANGKGDASVLLELVIDANGVVSDAQVIEGADPFAESARLAALSWQFTPARQAATAVAAKIRARVEFHPPQAASPKPEAPKPPSAAVEPTAAAPRPATPEQPLDVTVRGVRPAVGQTTLSAAEMRALPGAFGDPFRAIDALPGVTPVVSGFPYFYIRGAPPNNNGYYVDGIRVPLLFHVGIGQAVIHPELIDRVDFFASAAPARFGRIAGALIAGQTREPATRLHGEAELRLVDAGALLEAPFGNRGSALVAARYGYPGPILSAITPDVKLDYWDYQTRAVWRISEHDSLGLFAFGSHDYLAAATTSTAMSSAMGPTMVTSTLVEQFVSDFHRLDLRYDHASNNGQVRFAATGGYDSQGAAPTYLSDRSAAVRLEIDQRLADSVRMRAGADARFDDYAFKQRASDSPRPVVPSSANPAPTNLSGGVHADLVWRVHPRVEIVPGARMDLFDSTRANAPGATSKTSVTALGFDPRLAARVTITPELASLSSVGLAHQYPVLRIGDVPPAAASGSGFPVGNSRLQAALQASQGIELALPGDIVLTTSGFVTRWSGLTDLTASCLQIMPPEFAANDTGEPRPEPPYLCPSNQPVRGQSYGLEVLVRRSFSKRVSGALSYTLSRSTRTAHFLTLDGGDATATVPSEFDRTHVLNASLSWDLGARWRVGGRLVFYSGSPYSTLAGNVPVPPYNNQRTPNFVRLDLRLEKRWQIGNNGSLAFVLEGQNVTLSKEVTSLALNCMGEMSPEAGTTRCTHGEVGPITIPSVGVEAFF